MLMIEELYDALKEAGASDDKARTAARAVAQYENRLNDMTSELKLHRWMLGYISAAVTAILYRTLTS